VHPLLSGPHTDIGLTCTSIDMSVRNEPEKTQQTEGGLSVASYRLGLVRSSCGSVRFVLCPSC